MGSQVPVCQDLTLSGKAAGRKFRISLRLESGRTPSIDRAAAVFTLKTSGFAGCSIEQLPAVSPGFHNKSSGNEPGP
jgi:hypothetical protein